MHYSPAFDVAGPGLLVAAAGVSLLVLCIIILIVVGLESLVLWRLRWGPYKRALLAAFVMNLATSILGVAVVPFTLQLRFWGLLIDFAVSVLVEGGILMLFKRGAARENLVAALAANSASYVLIMLPLYLFYGLLG